VPGLPQAATEQRAVTGWNLFGILEPEYSGRHEEAADSGGICLFSWPWHWMEVNCELHAAVALPPGEEPTVSFIQEAELAAESVQTLWNGKEPS
jgi:hypothetical protein